MPAHKPWRVLSSSVAHETPFFSVLREDVLVSDGTRRDYYTLSFPGPAVGIIAHRGTDILLIRQYRFIVDQFVWAIPSGGASEAETSIDAARRELEEETGYRAARIEPFMTCFASYGCSNQRFEIFAAEEPVQTSAYDSTEVLEVRWFERRELLELVRRNAIVDNLSLSPILLFLLQGGPR
ncbi:MAG: NUDIX hydrolase [Acidobacteriaceae bacterium]|nr:NUDIX hydrolase [Acidobacteriaceae bacterium]MBV8573016.1 NUDIX hydrolase [Acidobacteriaceae bacterium]